LTFQDEVPGLGLARLLALESGLAAEISLPGPWTGTDHLSGVGKGLPAFIRRPGILPGSPRRSFPESFVSRLSQGLLGPAGVPLVQGHKAFRRGPADFLGELRVAGQLAQQVSRFFRGRVSCQGPSRLAQSTSRFGLLLTLGEGPSSRSGAWWEVQVGLQLLGEGGHAFQDVAGIDLGVLQGFLEALKTGLEFSHSRSLAVPRQIKVATQFAGLHAGGREGLGVRALPGEPLGGKAGQGDRQAGQKQARAEPGRPALRESCARVDVPGPVGGVAQKDLGHDVPGTLGGKPLDGRPHSFLQPQVAVRQVGHPDGFQGSQELRQGRASGKQGHGSKALPGGLAQATKQEDQDQGQDGSGGQSPRRDVQGPDLALSCSELASLLQQPHLVHVRGIPRFGGRPCGGGGGGAGELVLNMDSRGFHMLDCRRFQWLVPCLLLVLLGCSSPPQEPEPPAASETGAPGAQAPELEAPPASGRLEFRMPVEVVRANLGVRQPGQKWQLVDGEARPLAEFKVQSDRVKVKDAQDRELFKVKSKLKGWELEDATGQRLLRARPHQGGWQIEDGAEARFARIFERDGALVLEDAQGRELTRARAESGQVLFRDPSGTEQAVLRGSSDPRVAIWWMLPDTDPLAQAALVVFALEVR